MTSEQTATPDPAPAALPSLTRLLMVAESIDGHAAIASRAGQMEELEKEAAVLREIHAELRAASAAPETSPDELVRDMSPVQLVAVHDAVDALRLIAGERCSNFTGPWRCSDEGSGRTRSARYTADAWCDACIAQDALDRATPSTDTTPSPETR